MSLLSKVATKIEKIIHGTSVMGGRAGGILLALMVVLIAINVVGRYAFNHPLKGDVDFIEELMVLMIFLSIAFCAAQKRHIVVAVVVTRLSELTRVVLETVTTFASLVFVGLMTWQLGARGWAMLSQPRYSATLNWPLAPLYFVAALGCVMLWLELVISFFSCLDRVVHRDTGK
jgi:TRAP-type C4-dicarboxylate transport system permease small subunit